jgi:hypothetical protein
VATVTHTVNGYAPKIIVGSGTAGVTKTLPVGTYGFEAGPLVYSAAVFCVCAVLGIIALWVRRTTHGYELGGLSNASRSEAKGYRLFFWGLWLFFIVTTAANATKPEFDY